MGRIVKVLSFLRALRNGAKLSDVKVDAGGGDNINAEHFAPIGDDSNPLPDDYAVTLPVQREGNEVVVGYADTQSDPKAEAGEKRIYARSSQGTVVVEIWLKNTGDAVLSNDKATFELKADGSIKGSNASGSFELQAGGDFFVNGVTIDTSGNITSPATITAPNLSGTTSVKAAGKELANHTHIGSVSCGDSIGPNI